jgi:sulfoxide reductase heme-binding subunit YedZ
MAGAQPLQSLWWLISRAAGIVALILISLSVILGLAMAAKLVRRPSLKRAAIGLHEHLALTALGAIAVHGLALLGDHWLDPGWRGITIPFVLGYRSGFTGIGIIAGYLAVLLGPSFHLRRRIGARRWRRLHRATVLIWLLSAVHALGAGSDGATGWLRAVVLAPVAPIVYVLVVRMLGAERTPAPRAAQPVPAEPARRERRRTGAGGEPARHDCRREHLEAASEVSRS